MEKLKHTSDGQLISEDPFLIVGTKYKYADGRMKDEYGVVTKKSVEKTKTDTQHRVWGAWGSEDEDVPLWSLRQEMEVISIGDNKTNT